MFALKRFFNVHIVCLVANAKKSYVTLCTIFQVTVHLLDGTIADGQLLYYQPYYDLAFLRVRVDQPVHLPSFNEEVKLAKEAFRLERDNMLDLRITYGRGVYENPTTYERYHNMYFHCAGGANDDKKVMFLIT